ncbi:hypothetical protein KOR34_31980 [Posidoniimonas corsicana]|uniref:Uncharacterized protein n=1 Tax=Posidoniimonas corsicana TaxID=1938618 RepID=A0A5C5VK29_9BACT|nr:hypothetical protein [Posidoniimonas corsicana]TWT38229.1 hypothetical protein KOR34_31980 [Posidoniimonas corsicana]
MPDTAPRRRPLLPYTMLAIGIAAVVVGLFWKSIVPDSAFWSEQQAEEYQQAYAAAHEASIHGASEGGLSLDETRANFQAKQQQLATARQARGVWGKIIAVGGVSLAAAGAWLLRASDSAG